MNSGNGRLTWTVLPSPRSAASCPNEGSTTDPPARWRASAKARSSTALEGELKSTSNAISLTPALSSLSISSACSDRGHGHTPIFSIENGSIATSTMSPVAWRGNHAKRKSAMAFCNVSWVPLSRTTARTHATKKCARYCLIRDPPPRSSARPRAAPPGAAAATAGRHVAARLRLRHKRPIETMSATPPPTAEQKSRSKVMSSLPLLRCSARPKKALPHAGRSTLHPSL